LPECDVVIEPASDTKLNHDGTKCESMNPKHG